MVPLYLIHLEYLAEKRPAHLVGLAPLDYLVNLAPLACLACLELLVNLEHPGFPVVLAVLDFQFVLVCLAKLYLEHPEVLAVLVYQ